ncbi:MAG: hypothetical protein R3D65_13300 [Zhengella sp.]
MSRPSAFASYLRRNSSKARTEPANDVEEPDFLFDLAQDALKAMVSGLDQAIAGRLTTP